VPRPPHRRCAPPRRGPRSGRPSCAGTRVPRRRRRACSVSLPCPCTRSAHRRRLTLGSWTVRGWPDRGPSGAGPAVAAAAEAGLVEPADPVLGAAGHAGAAVVVVCGGWRRRTRRVACVSGCGPDVVRGRFRHGQRCCCGGGVGLGAVAGAGVPGAVDRAAGEHDRHLDADRRGAVAAGRGTERGHVGRVGADRRDGADADG
jgi:hypothetical protein